MLRRRDKVASWNIALTTFALGQNNSSKKPLENIFISLRRHFFFLCRRKQQDNTMNILSFSGCTTAIHWNSCFLLLKYLFDSVLVSLNKIPVTHSHFQFYCNYLWFFFTFRMKFHHLYILCNLQRKKKKYCIFNVSVDFETDCVESGTRERERQR